MEVRFNKPYINSNLLQSIWHVMDDEHLSSGGNYTMLCQEWLEKFTSCKKVLLTQSCTNALEMAAILCSIEEGDEVIMPSYTHPSTANAFVLRGGVPVFVDICPKTLCIDEDKVEKAVTDKTRVIVAVHYAGVSCDMRKIMTIADKYDLIVIEDAAQAIDSYYEDKHLGTIGHMGALSFHETKNVTSVVGNTPILVKVDDKIYIDKIENLDLKYSSMECQVFSNNGTVFWHKVNEFIKHTHKGNIISIKLQKGRHVKTTPDHSIFVYDGNVKSKPSADLRIGDYVVCPRSINLTKTEDKVVSTIDISKVVSSNISISDTHITYKKHCRFGGVGKRTRRFLEVNEDLCKLLGYYAAEGGFNSNLAGINFTFSYDEFDYVNEVIDIFTNIFPNYKLNNYRIKEKNIWSVRSGSRMIGEIFKGLDVGSCCYNKKIPSVIWSTTDRNKLAFIDGLLKGDGHRRNINGSKSSKLKVASVDLANGLHYLLLSIGISSRVEQGEHYSENGNLRKEYSCEILGDWHNQITNRENCIPTEFIFPTSVCDCNKIKRIKQKKSITLKTVRKWLDEGCISVDQFLLGDICLLKIVKLENEEFSGNVYDFKINEFENFIGGYGAICLHNCGEGGALLVNDDSYIARAKKIGEFGTNRSEFLEGKADKYSWVDVGSSFFPSEITVAFLYTQLLNTKIITKDRLRAWDRYYERLFYHTSEFGLPRSSFKKHNAHMFFILDYKNRDRHIYELNNSGVDARAHYVPLHSSLFSICNGFKTVGGIDVTVNISNSILRLPLWYGITREQIDFVVDKVLEIIK